MTKIDARSNPVTIAHVDDVAEWSKLLLVRATLGAGFRHQSSGVGSNPTIITTSPYRFVSVAELV